MRAGLKQFAAGAVAVGVIFFAGCNSSPTPAASDTPAAAAKPAGPPPPVSAQTAFSPMYKAALGWASDAELIRMTAKEVPGFKNEGGKAAMWEAGFGSPSKRQFRLYTYSIATVLPDIHKGADAELPLPWGGETRDAMPVEASSFNVDSDAAYKTAAADAAEWLAKNPTKTLTALELGNTSKFNSPVWYVSWGDKKSGGYVALVDASTGKVYKAKS